MSPRTVFIEGAYLLASILFVLGLRSLNYPDKARRGIQLAMVGMLLAIVVSNPRLRRRNGRNAVRSGNTARRLKPRPWPG